MCCCAVDVQGGCVMSAWLHRSAARGVMAARHVWRTFFRSGSLGPPEFAQVCDASASAHARRLRGLEIAHFSNGISRLCGQGGLVEEPVSTTRVGGPPVVHRARRSSSRRSARGRTSSWRSRGAAAVNDNGLNWASRYHGRVSARVRVLPQLLVAEDAFGVRCVHKGPASG